MKKIIATLILSGTTIIANAGYTLKIPLEQAQGGFLPNGSISIKSQNLTGNYEYSCFFRPKNTSGTVSLSTFSGTCINGALTGNIGPGGITDGFCNEDRNISFKAGPVTYPLQYCPEP